MKDIYPTSHALESMANRAVTWGDIVDVTSAPEVVYGPDQNGRRVLQKGDLSVVVARDGAVVTVLLRSEAKWNNDDARNR